MSIKENIDIFIITYNRSAKLEETLAKIYEDDSPIKDFHITILDNGSTDQTEKICHKYINSFVNSKYIRNKINIGVSGNIIKTMELSDKKWFWILCDDDKYDWSAWKEIESALQEDYDVVMTGYTAGYRSTEYPYLINEMAFLPQAIYNTKNLNQEVINNAYGLCQTGFVQHALGCKILNNSGKIFVPEQRLVIQTYEEKNQGLRGLYKPNLYHKLGHFNIIYGYIETYSLINDLNLRSECFDVLCLGETFESSLACMETMGVKPFQYFDIYMVLDKSHKKRFVKYYIKKYLNIFLAKPVKYFLKQLFSVTTENVHKKFTICGIKIKFKRKR